MDRLIRVSFCVIAVVLLWPSLAVAQTGAFAWTATNQATGPAAQALIYTLYTTPLGQPTLPGVVLTGVACTGVGQPTVTCTAPFPAGVPVTTGTEYTLSARATTTSTESARSLPFTQPAPPAPPPDAPTNFRRQ